MLVVRKIKTLQHLLKTRCHNKSIGLVPTMGDLHEGHLSLIRRSIKENDRTIVSIFVNPIQFNQRKDYELYHRDEKNDLKKAKKEGVDLVFIPSVEELYPKDFQTFVTVAKMSKGLCGRSRPGHFKGVATVVLKLFHSVRPTRAYFGLKDFQQCRLIEQMVKDLNLPVKIVPCPIVREWDGLALSSRNRRLSPEQRQRATTIFSALQSVADLIKSKRSVSSNFLFRHFARHLRIKKEDRIEYMETVHPDTLEPLKKPKPPALLATAIWIGKTRLIDNLLVEK